MHQRLHNNMKCEAVKYLHFKRTKSSNVISKRLIKMAFHLSAQEPLTFVPFAMGIINENLAFSFHYTMHNICIKIYNTISLGKLKKKYLFLIEIGKIPVWTIFFSFIIENIPPNMQCILRSINKHTSEHMAGVCFIYTEFS